jgi:tRNA 2-selenouridine synthase SelU
MSLSPKQVGVLCLLEILKESELAHYPVENHMDGKVTPIRETKTKEQLIKLTAPLRTRLQKLADKYIDEKPADKKKAVAKIKADEASDW